MSSKVVEEGFGRGGEGVDCRRSIERAEGEDGAARKSDVDA